MDQRILSGLERDRQEIIENAIRLIGIPSVSEDMEQCKKAALMITELAKELGMHAYTVLEGRIGVVEIGSGEETIGILVHVDVVPPGDLALWEKSPFEGYVKDGFLYGRGAMDDKGPCIACLYAMKAVLESGEPLKKKIQMIIGTQEEVEWTDMEAYTKHFPLPDYGFTPDGSFPIINIEKGYIDVYTYFDTNACFHTTAQGKGIENTKRTTGIEVRELTGGESVNSIPGSASANVLNQDKDGDGDKSPDGERIVVKGKSAHSSVPEEGDNAIEHLCHRLNQLELAGSPAKNAISFVDDCFYQKIHGEGLGLRTEEKDKYYNGEFIDATVICPTMMSQDGDKVTVVFNVRTSYGTNQEDIAKAFGNKAGQYGFTLACKNVLEPLYVHQERPFLKTMNAAYEQVLGLPGGFILAHGTSYAKAMPNMVAWGPVFPDEEDYCHQADERFSIESMMKSAKLYALALQEMAVSDESFQ